MAQNLHQEFGIVTLFFSLFTSVSCSNFHKTVIFMEQNILEITAHIFFDLGKKEKKSFKEYLNNCFKKIFVMYIAFFLFQINN